MKNHVIVQSLAKKTGIFSTMKIALTAENRALQSPAPSFARSFTQRKAEKPYFIRFCRGTPVVPDGNSISSQVAIVGAISGTTTGSEEEPL